MIESAERRELVESIDPFLFSAVLGRFAYMLGASLMIVFTIPGLSYTMSFMNMTVCCGTSIFGG